jgi:ubiquinone/menaquinone biosynthesis C-methylase UbiE
MGFYEERVLPHIINVVMNSRQTRERRGEVCRELNGEVIEIGFGTGLNVPHYPAQVSGISAVEPSQRSVRLAGKRLAACTVRVEIVGLDGQRIDLPDASFDGALSTWTLCTIPDVEAALGEIYRVLKPGGIFHFVEHGLAPDAKVVRRQRRFEPLNKRLAGGCHLTRDIPALIESAGFEIASVDSGYESGAPKPWGFQYLGQARKA